MLWLILGILWTLLMVWLVLAIIKICQFYLDSNKPIVIIKPNDTNDYCVKNIGKNAAFNITVFHKHYEVNNPGEWKELTRISILDKKESAILDLSDELKGEDFGVMFNDFKENNYFSTWIDKRIEIKKGRLV